MLGRTDRYFVRRYEDETNLRVYLVIDRSASMGYASEEQQSKYDYACHLAAAIGYVVVKGKDSVGMCVYADKIDANIGRAKFLFPSQQRPGHAQGLQAGLEDQHGPVLSIASPIQSGGARLVILFSDLFDEQADIVRAIAHFRKLHHDVIVFHILDPMEVDLSFKKGAEFVDMETGGDRRRRSARHRGRLPQGFRRVPRGIPETVARR